MANDNPLLQPLLDAIASIGEDTAAIGKFRNGGPDETVDTDSGPVPTLQKFIADSDDRVSDLISEYVQTSTDAKTSASLAEAARVDAEQSSALARAGIKGVYTSDAAGLAATSDGELYYVTDFDQQRLNLYLNDGGTSVAQNLDMPGASAVSSRGRSLFVQTGGAGGDTNQAGASIELLADNTVKFSGMSFNVQATSRSDSYKHLWQYETPLGLTGTYEFEDGDVLFLTPDGPAFQKANADYNYEDAICLLAWVDNRFCPDTLLYPLILEEKIRRSTEGPLFLNWNPASGNPSDAVTVSGMTIAFKNMRIYAADRQGERAVSPYYGGNSGSVGFTETFDMVTGDVLIWNTDTNELLISNYDDLPFNYQLIAHATSGELNYIEPGLQTLLALQSQQGVHSQSSHFPTERRCNRTNWFSINQDATLVGDKIVTLEASDTGGTMKSGHIFDLHTLQELKTISHNWGHAGALDYSTHHNAFSFGGYGYGETGDVERSRVVLFLNAREQLEKDTWDVSVDEHLFIYLDNVDESGAIVSSIFEPGTVNESDYKIPHLIFDNAQARHAYAFISSPRSKMQIAELVLGVGDTNLALEENGFGEFLPGKADDQLNGTVRVIQKWASDFIGSTQGCCFHAGYFYRGSSDQAGGSTSRSNVEAFRFALGDDGTVTTDRRYALQPFELNGDPVLGESESAFTDGVYFYHSINHYQGGGIGGSQMVIFPLNSDSPMQGSAVIENGGTVDVVFPFDCHSTPRVHITATNAEAADCYVSSKSADGFTVAGAAGGTFDWSAPIS